jgi:oxygen-independent coproporphyrinogen-3 oxidase
MNATASFPADTAPRYTSYPTAPHFHAGIGPDTVRRWFASLPVGDTLSLYIHVPFCDKLCWFCACHTKHTRHYAPVAKFLIALHQEIRQVATMMPRGARVGAIHFGGGSPTMLTPADFLHLMGMLRSSFHVEQGASISVEIDPNDMDTERLDSLAAAGLTRASLGVQDFDPKVQKAINRLQSFELTQSVVEGLRVRGVGSVNLDLLYGLPHQTEASVSDTVRKALLLRPDRMALFGYAHVPWFKKHQTMIDESVLPDASERLTQATAAAAIISAAGYEAIGIDHFALPGDSLALAAREGRLRRNFQGYTDDPCETLIGLGPSSISRFRQGYAQNTTAAGDYERKIAAGDLATVRGVELSDQDRAAAWIIERLMCDFAFSADELVSLHGYWGLAFLQHARRLAANAPEELVAENGRFVIPPAHRPFTRLVAARFDTYFPNGNARHSAAV